jgi:hypothetical protein
MTNHLFRSSLWSILLISILFSGCGSENGSSDSQGEGTLDFKISGEDGAKTGFPVDDAGEIIEFADGWTLEFSKYLVSIGDFTVFGADNSSGYSSNQTYIVDLHQGDPSLFSTPKLGARRWEKISWKMIPPTSSSINISNINNTDIQRMIDNGFNYWIEGSAKKADKSYTFQLGFSNPTNNQNCTNGIDNSQGIVVRPNSNVEAEVTIHVEHMFWDTLGSEQVRLRFDAIAASSTDDTLVTNDDLKTQKLSDLRGLDGKQLVDSDGKTIVYNPASIPLKGQTLYDFMSASLSTGAHLNGSGLCTISTR